MYFNFSNHTHQYKEQKYTFHYKNKENKNKNTLGPSRYLFSKKQKVLKALKEFKIHYFLTSPN